MRNIHWCFYNIFRCSSMFVLKKLWGNCKWDYSCARVVAAPAQFHFTLQKIIISFFPSFSNRRFHIIFLFESHGNLKSFLKLNFDYLIFKVTKFWNENSSYKFYVIYSVVLEKIFSILLSMNIRCGFQLLMVNAANLAPHFNSDEVQSSLLI